MGKYRFEQIAFNSTEKKKPVEEDRFTYLGLEHLDPGSLKVTRFGSEVAPKGEKLIMHKGDVLFGKRRAYQKKVAIAPFDGIFSAHGMVLRPREEVIDKDFFPLFISSDYFLDAAISISVGSLSPTINWRDLKNLEFELPDLETQKKLAEVLWAMNETIESYKTMLSVTDELVKSQFIEMFGDPATNSKGLPVYKVGELCDVTKLAGYEYTEYIHYQDSGDVVMIKGLNVKEKHLKLDDISYINAEVSDSLPRSQLHEGDVVMTYIGINLGDVAIVDGNHRYHLAPNVAKISVKNKASLIPEFLVNQIYYSRDKFTRNAGNTAKAVLNMEKIRKIDVFLPDVDAQRNFIEFVEQSDKSKLFLQKQIDRRSLKCSMKIIQQSR